MPDDAASPPLVSVIVPAFNHEAFVEEAVHSVLAQTYSAVELIVIDDGSTDETPEILHRLSREHGFLVVRNEANVGLNATLEKGLSLSSGEYVSILASDDRLMHDKIEEQINYLTQTKLDAVYGTCSLLFEDGRTQFVDLSDLTNGFVDGSVLDRLYTDSSHAPLLQSALIKRECFLNLQSERSRFKSDDWVMLIRLVERYQVGFVNKAQFLYRQHGANTYRDYWATLPNRTEVIAMVTPERLRALGLANMFRDQAQFLYMDGKPFLALKFLVASMALNPSPWSWVALVRELSRRMGRQITRRYFRRS